MRYGYIRDSRTDTKSLEVQREIILTKFADAKVEDSSWDTLIDSLTEGDEVVVVSASRIARDFSDYEKKNRQIAEKGASLIVLDAGESAAYAVTAGFMDAVRDSDWAE